MLAFFCEECGGRNTIDIDTSDSNDRHIKCRICHELIPLPKIRANAIRKNMVDTKSFKILIADDEERHLELLRIVLENEYSVITASGGEEALRLAPEVNPDLILLDVMMPDILGYEVCRQLKVDKRTRHIPVIFITSMADIVNEQKGLEAGAVDYITKPISFFIAKSRIATHLELKRQSDERKKRAGELNRSVRWLENRIVDHQLAEMEALQVKAELELTLDAVEEIVTVQDVERRIVRVNKAACRTFQATADELIGKYCYEVFHGASEPCDNCPGIETLPAATAKPIRIYNKKLDKIFMVNHFPRFDDRGDLIGEMHLAKEISLRQLISSIPPEKPEDALVSETIRKGILRHVKVDKLLEIINTLTIISVNSQLIEKLYQNDAKVSEKTEYINNAVSRISVLITKIVNESLEQ
jgi:DNA-binding response OmpR family regulator